MTKPDRWRKSSHSAAQSNCVELRGDLTGVRDSKTQGGPVLTCDVSALIDAVKAGKIG